MNQVAYADFRELTVDEIDMVSGGMMSREDMMISFAIGVGATLAAPYIAAGAGVIALGALINLAVATPAH